MAAKFGNKCKKACKGDCDADDDLDDDDDGDLLMIMMLMILKSQCKQVEANVAQDSL